MAHPPGRPPAAGLPIDDMVAVVVATRPYALIELIQTLVRHRFTSIERGRHDALAFVQHLQPELVVAAVDPTGIEDLDLLRSLSRASTALVMVLAPTGEALAAALRAGADVFVRDGDGPEALEAQLVALRRRLRMERIQEPEDLVIEAGPIRINRAARKAWTGETELPLTNMEFSLLLALVEDQGRVLSPLQAARASTGRFISEAEANQTIKVYIRRLRHKLEEAGCPASVIVNVRGRGYMFDPTSNQADAGTLSGAV